MEGGVIISISIKGSKLIDTNNYEKIIIREENERYIVNIKGTDAPYPTLPLSYNFSMDIKDGSDEENVIKIIQRFLDYNNISFLEDGMFLPHYSGRFSVIRGTREMCLQLFNGNFNIIPKMVKDKYINDRLNFCEENKEVNMYELYLNYKGTSYEKKDANFGRYISFNLLGNHKKVAQFEKEFLKNFISNKLYEQGEEASIKESVFYSSNSDNCVQLGNYLVCGNLSIRLCQNNDLMNTVTSIVNEYNSKREECKKMQLKMEGF